MPKQFVGFFLRRQAVIPRDSNLDIGGNDVALQRVNFSEHLVGHGDGIGAGPLGDGQGHGRLFIGHCAVRRTRSKKNILARLFRAVHDVGHIAQINRLAAEHADHHVAHVPGIGQKRAGFHDDFLVVAGQFAGGELPVRLLQHRQQTGGGEIARRQSHRVEQHAHLPLRAADEGGFGHLRHLFHRIVHLRDQPAQGEMIVTRAVKRERQNRHVVNRPRLDDRRETPCGILSKLDCSF